MTAPRLGRWALGSVLAVSAIVALLFGRATHHMRRDSASCTIACHSPEKHPAAWRTAGGHGAVPCQGCHELATKAALGLVWARLFGRKPASHAKVEARACSSCHDASSDRGRLTAETAGHRAHGPEIEKVSCLSCHAKSTHAGTGAGDSCKSCHASDRLHHATPEGESCTSCHNFALGKPGEDRLTVMECSRCHADPGALARGSKPADVAGKLLVTGEMLHGSVDCKLCHQPHRPIPKESIETGAPTRFANATPDDSEIVAGARVCRSCHEIQMGSRGKHVPEGHANCAKCHAPHAPIEQFVRACKECHEQGRELASGRQSTALHHESCASCHVPHTWQAARSGCVQCHDEKASILLAKSPPEHQQCQSCHKPHAPLPGGEACVQCHKNRAGHLSAAPGKHKNCASCHEPHTAKVLPRAACAGCHTAPNNQLVNQGPEQHERAGCLGCHQPHMSPLPKPGLCASCHTSQSAAVTKAEPERHKLCASCHQPHRFKVADGSAPCAKCHQPIADSPGPHAGTCTQCHEQHGSPRVSRAQCTKCHDNVHLKPPPGNVQHANCRSCHQPHRPASMAVQECRNCHAEKARVATAWPASSAHAEACNRCHQQHDVRDVKKCASCHASEATSAQGGKHRCEQCHPPHQEPPGLGHAWWKRCSSCHASQTEQANAGKKHFDCSKCHQPHRFTPPSCSSCHASQIKTAGHAIKQHQTCRDCHTTHLASLPERAQCLRCHTDKTQHQSAASSCQACHPFK